MNQIPNIEGKGGTKGASGSSLSAYGSAESPVNNTRECPYCQGHDCPECDALTHNTREIEDWKAQLKERAVWSSQCSNIKVLTLRQAERLIQEALAQKDAEVTRLKVELEAEKMSRGIDNTNN